MLGRGQIATEMGQIEVRYSDRAGRVGEVGEVRLGLVGQDRG